MKIGVNGASGQLGKQVITERRARGSEHDVVAISRTPASLDQAVEGRFGDYDEPDSLAAAYAALDRLLLIPTTDLEPGHRAAQFVAAIDAAAAAGVKHVVLVSAAGTKKAEEPSMDAAYWIAEQKLIAQAPAWTILRMGYFAEALAIEALGSLDRGVLTGLGENRVGFVSRDDVAAAAAGILLGEGHEGAIYTATSDERFTGAERAALIAEITGRPMSFLMLPEDHLRGGLAQARLPDAVVNAVIAIQQRFVEGAFDLVTGDVERLSGRPPKRLRDVLEPALRQPPSL